MPRIAAFGHKRPFVLFTDKIKAVALLVKNLHFPFIDTEWRIVFQRSFSGFNFKNHAKYGIAAYDPKQA